MTDQIEQTARRIAELGNGALRRRLRPAFDHAVATYADRITIRSDELDRMLEAAAQCADAAIWRRALASVAMDELNIGLGEALEHPAVIRAQEIVGAPALDRAVFSTAPAPEAEAQLDAPPLQAAEPPLQLDQPPLQPDVPTEPEAVVVELPDVLPQPNALPGPAALREPVAGVVAALEPEAIAELEALIEPEPEPLLDLSPPTESAPLPDQTIRLAAVHLDGIENLPSAGKYLELRFSEAGFDVVDAEEGDVIGRLPWDEIDALELPRERGSLGRRRRRRTRAQLVVRAGRGEASFEIRGLTDGELREHLAPIVAKVKAARRAR